MATVRILRELWRLRRYVAGVCVVALLAGMLVTTRLSFPPSSKSYDVGTATAQVLVDTPQSQIVDDSSSTSAVGAQTLGTLGVQANLLAGLMVEGPIKADIARRAGLKPSKLVGASAAVTVPSASSSGSGSSSTASSVSVPGGQNVYALTTQIVTDSGGLNTLPIIEINTQAPDLRKAINLANAAVAGLQAYISSEAANERIPNADRLSIMSLGVSQAATQKRGPSPLIGALVALVVLLVGCALIYWIQGLIRGWHSVSERERPGPEEPWEGEAERATYQPALTPIPPRRLLVAGDQRGRPHGGTNGSSGKPGTNGSSGKLGTNGSSGQHGSNGSSGKHDGGGVTVATENSSLTAGDTVCEPPLSSRQWSSRQWSPRKG